MLEKEKMKQMWQETEVHRKANDEEMEKLKNEVKKARVIMFERDELLLQTEILLLTLDVSVNRTNWAKLLWEKWGTEKELKKVKSDFEQLKLVIG